MEENYVFTNWVDYEKVPYYINAIDIGLATLTKKKIALSGSASQKVRQYLASGVPVIAGYGEGHQFIEYNDLGKLVDLENASEFACAIDNLLTRMDREGDEIRLKARKYAIKNFSMQRIIEGYYELWSNVASTYDYRTNDGAGTGFKK